MSTEPVGHQLKLSVGGDEGDRSVILKSKKFEF